jgi:hypothetical protein
MSDRVNTFLDTLNDQMGIKKKPPPIKCVICHKRIPKANVEKLRGFGYKPEEYTCGFTCAVKLQKAKVYTCRMCKHCTPTIENMAPIFRDGYITTRGSIDIATCKYVRCLNNPTKIGEVTINKPNDELRALTQLQLEILYRQTPQENVAMLDTRLIVRPKKLEDTMSISEIFNAQRNEGVFPVQYDPAVVLACTNFQKIGTATHIQNPVSTTGEFTVDGDDIDDEYE